MRIVIRTYVNGYTHIRVWLYAHTRIVIHTLFIQTVKCCLTKKLFIKVLMVRRFKEKFCVSAVASASHLRDVYCLKRSEDLVEIIISLVILDTDRSFKQ